MRGLNKASSPAEAEKAAQALINSFRERGINGHEITEILGKRNPSPWANQSKVSAPRTPVTPRALYR